MSLEVHHNIHLLGYRQVGKPNGLLGANPATKQKRFIQIPHVSNNHFIGRERELLWLQVPLEDLSPNKEQQRMAAWGPGGADKTQLVSTYAFRS